MEKLVIRKAKNEDVGTILHFIQSLAEYEKLTHEVTATEEILLKTLFSESSNAYALLGYYNEKPVCFAIYFYNFSTFKGKPGLYLEDVFVLPEMRGKGFGKQMLIELAKIADENNCGRFEWSVLDWNEPAINFYKKLGAKPMDEWTVFRLDEEGIKNLSESK
ncbi:MAG: GNAT family N-acetyltransferase [Ignavibacteriales bacterium]